MIRDDLVNEFAKKKPQNTTPKQNTIQTNTKPHARSKSTLVEKQIKWLFHEEKSLQVIISILQVILLTGEPASYDQSTGNKEVEL